jgi:hypothetical protein
MEACQAMPRLAGVVSRTEEYSHHRVGHDVKVEGPAVRKEFQHLAQLNRGTAELCALLTVPASARNKVLVEVDFDIYST